MFHEFTIQIEKKCLTKSYKNCKPKKISMPKKERKNSIIFITITESSDIV